jgi:hypothetical protein
MDWFVFRTMNPIWSGRFDQEARAVTRRKHAGPHMALTLFRMSLLANLTQAKRALPDGAKPLRSSEISTFEKLTTPTPATISEDTFRQVVLATLGVLHGHCGRKVELLQDSTEDPSLDSFHWSRTAKLPVRGVLSHSRRHNGCRGFVIDHYAKRAPDAPFDLVGILHHQGLYDDFVPARDRVIKEKDKNIQVLSQYIPTKKRMDLFASTCCRVPARVAGIYDAGKVRAITAAEGAAQIRGQEILRFLGRNIRRRGRLFTFANGPVEAASFTRDVGSESPLFLSGDFTAATDTLSSDVSRAIALAIAIFYELDDPELSDLVSLLTEHAILVPGTGTKNKKPEYRSQTVGQLMGSFASFPVLCLANAAVLAIARTRAAGRNSDQDYVHAGATLRAAANGDDLAASVTWTEYQSWGRTCDEVGWRFSPAKNYVSSRMSDSLFEVKAQATRPFIFFSSVLLAFDSRTQHFEKVAWNSARLAGDVLLSDGRGPSKLPTKPELTGVVAAVEKAWSNANLSPESEHDIENLHYMRSTILRRWRKVQTPGLGEVPLSLAPRYGGLGLGTAGDVMSHHDRCWAGSFRREEIPSYPMPETEVMPEMLEAEKLLKTAVQNGLRADEIPKDTVRYSLGRDLGFDDDLVRDLPMYEVPPFEYVEWPTKSRLLELLAAAIRHEHLRMNPHKLEPVKRRGSWKTWRKKVDRVRESSLWSPRLTGPGGSLTDVELRRSKMVDVYHPSVYTLLVDHIKSSEMQNAGLTIPITPSWTDCRLPSTGFEFAPEDPWLLDIISNLPSPIESVKEELEEMELSIGVPAR